MVAAEGLLLSWRRCVLRDDAVLAGCVGAAGGEGAGWLAAVKREREKGMRGAA